MAMHPSPKTLRTLEEVFPEVKKHIRREPRPVWIFTCPICGKEIVGVRLEEVWARAGYHLDKHQRHHKGVHYLKLIQPSENNEEKEEK